MRGRLQREADFTGQRLTRFRDVFLRHGLPGFVLALGFLALLATDVDFSDGAELLPRSGQQYLVFCLVAGAALLAHSRLTLGRWDAATLAWIGYLALLSIWEEWAFRVGLSTILQGEGASFWLAALLVNLAFGLMHYFTLRWRWQWCVAAAIGGLALSRHFHQHSDIILIVLFHWVGTTLNTPRPPGVAP